MIARKTATIAAGAAANADSKHKNIKKKDETQNPNSQQKKCKFTQRSLRLLKK